MVEKRLFGKTSNSEPVYAYQIVNRNGVSVTVLDYGCTLQSVVIPLREKNVDVCLGYDTVREYEQNDGYVGAVIGRYAGRIPGGELNLNGNRYSLYRNDGENHLHGGLVGFDKRIWRAEASDSAVRFYYTSPDGEEAYPFALSVSVTYTLKDDNTLEIKFKGESDGLTVWNPTNHAYWNLNGHESGPVLSHMLKIPASYFVPVDRSLIPIGIEQSVDGTPFDFRNPRFISDGFKTPCILETGGYDHSFVLSDGTIELIGNSGIRMQVKTNCRAVQFYSANSLSDRHGKHGAVYRPHNAVCLETESRQLFRDQPMPEESILHKNETKEHISEFRFLFE